MRIVTICSLLIVWQVTVSVFAPQDLPSISQVLSSLHWHTVHGDLLINTGKTLLRVFIAFSCAMLIGSVIGMCMGGNEIVDDIGDGLLVILLNIPALVIIILAYIWIGLVEAAAIGAVVINKIPTLVVAVREGARVIDRQLIEVAQVYKLPWWRYIRAVYLPQLYPYLIAGARNGLSLIWKIVLVVELLGRSDGVGFALHNLFQFFDIAGILAYTFVFIAVIFLVESLIFRPFDKVIQRGRYG